MMTEYLQVSVGPDIWIMGRKLFSRDFRETEGMSVWRHRDMIFSKRTPWRRVPGEEYSSGYFTVEEHSKPCG